MSADDKQKRLNDQHERGQKDATKGDYKPVFKSRVVRDIIATEDAEEQDKAYDAGWKNARKQKR